MIPPEAKPEVEAGAESTSALILELLAQLWRLDAALAEPGAAPDVPAHLRGPVEELRRVRARLAALRAGLARS
jgi:hypothetical protein